MMIAPGFFPMAEQWLSIVEYARTFKVSDMTVRRRIKTGKLHAVLKEGKYFIPIPGEGHAARAPKATTQPVMKAHPSPHRTFEAASRQQHQPQMQQHQPQVHQPQVHQPQMHQHASQPVFDEAAFDDFEDATQIPAAVRRSFASHDVATVEARALLAFCDAALKKASDGERRSVERFKAKLEALEAQVSLKDLEIKSLKQAMEDLQLLVRVMEKKNRHASP